MYTPVNRSFTIRVKEAFKGFKITYTVGVFLWLNADKSLPQSASKHTMFIQSGINIDSTYDVELTLMRRCINVIYLRPRK